MIRPILVALLISVATSCSEEENVQQQDVDLLKTIKTLRETGDIPALALADFSCADRKLAWNGQSRLNAPSPVSLDSGYAIGSNAKSMLATAAMRLAARGALDLDAPLEALWPEAVIEATDKRAITLRQLLSHSSGLPAFNTGAELGTVPTLTGSNREVIEGTAIWFLQQPLAGEPGTQTLYSNAGYVVAGAVLEHVTGASFASVIEREVFVPLGIGGAFGEPREINGGLTGHIIKDGEVTAYTDDEPAIPAFLAPAGNVVVGLPDYVTYLQSHLCGLQGKPNSLLSGAQATAMHTPVIEGGVGLGWATTEIGGYETSFHIGGTGDFTAFAALAPGKDQGVAALLNIGGSPAASVQAWVVETMSEETE